MDDPLAPLNCGERAGMYCQAQMLCYRQFYPLTSSGIGVKLFLSVESILEQQPQPSCYNQLCNSHTFKKYSLSGVLD